MLLVLGLALVGLDRLFPLHLPDPSTLFAQVVVDRQGIPLRAFADAQGVWRYPVRLDDVSPHYIEAVLGYEDRRFYDHLGINPLALLRAAGQNLAAGRVVSGGSTLSMQVARLLHPHSRTLWGKAIQIARTLQLEAHLNKQEILNLYLNLAPFGGTIEGVQAASFTYLHKPARDLTLAEAALLAVLPQAPSNYRPDRYPEQAQQARDKLLRRLARQGDWTAEAVAQALEEQVVAFPPRHPQHAPLLARRLIAEHPQEAVIRTTLEGTLQQGLEEYVAQYAATLPPHSSAAALVVDNNTGEVRAYVGSAGFGDAERFGHVDMIRAIRSPGSTLKPFLYAMALDEGLIHPQSLLADVPRIWGAYRPDNFGQGFSGPVTAASALQRSLNLPAVDLLERFGPKRFAARLENGGLPLHIPGQIPNLAVILGGAGCRLEDLVAAYRALAQGGTTGPLRFEKPETPGQSGAFVERRLLSPQSAWIVREILAEIPRPGALSHAVGAAPRPAWGWKTGTSYGFRDAWAIGVGALYTVGVWVGRPDGTPMPGNTGRNAAAPLLFAVTDHLDPDPLPIPRPEGVVRATICWPSGTPVQWLPDAQCPRRHEGWAIAGSLPPTWHPADQEAGRGGALSFRVASDTGLRIDPGCTVEHSQARTVQLWPKVLEPWLPKGQRRAGLIPPFDPRCTAALAQPTATLKIVGIEPDSLFYRPGGMGEGPRIALQALGAVGEVAWYVHGGFVARALSGEVVHHHLTLRGRVEIAAVDQGGQVDRVEVEVR
ncbi:MAG: penicillin-binding protein 1C [Alphaproteobacteria bacterium CG_4_10_14_0_2_um_filter_63_37]|nr:MAG: penicillin-binding protein 1C [Proteobacteria bacterium CG1_02_64_396]PJA26093.1 MAG: penicillin-binding protein 1C [Alphaproteobacteria bacterium CG_4_10_14_0_2_um_filter_63_37]